MNFCGKIRNNLIISKRHTIRMKPPPETTRYSLQFVQILEILFWVKLLEASLEMQTPLKISRPKCSLFLLILLLATQYALFLQQCLPPCWRNSQCDMPYQMPLRWRFDWNVDVLMNTCHHKNWGHVVKCMVCWQWTLLGNMDLGNHNVIFTYSMEQSPSSEANWFSASQEIPHILWNPKVHYRITSACHLSLSWDSSIQSISPHTTSCRSILILSSHLRLCSPVNHNVTKK